MLRKALMHAPGGSWGHLNRSMALGLELIASDFAVTILTSSQYASIVRFSESAKQISIVDYDQTVLANLVDELTPDDIFISDVFPVGVAGELKDILRNCQGRKALISRSMNDSYPAAMNMAMPGVMARFVESNYDIIISAGESDLAASGIGGFGFSRVVEKHVNPIVMRASARPCGLEAEVEGKVLVLVSGIEHEREWYESVCAAFTENHIPYIKLSGQHYPGIDFMAARPLAVVGSGGYNTVYEAAWAGVPLIGKAWPRRFDDQKRRLRINAALQVETVMDILAALNSPARFKSTNKVDHFESGAIEAARLISIQGRKAQKTEERELCTI